MRDFDSMYGTLTRLLVLSVIGCLAIIAGAAWLAWWLLSNTLA